MNIVAKRINENYESKSFKICDSRSVANYTDKNEKFRWVNAILVKWYNKYFIQLSFNVSNIYKNKRKCIKEIVIPANDMVREIKFYDDRWCITNSPLYKDAKYHHSEFVIDKNKLENLNDIKEFISKVKF